MHDGLFDSKDVGEGDSATVGLTAGETVGILLAMEGQRVWSTTGEEVVCSVLIIEGATDCDRLNDGEVVGLHDCKVGAGVGAFRV